MTTKPHIGIVGGGLMGVGIAQVFATAGHRVRVFEPVAAACAAILDRLRSNIQAVGDGVEAAALVTTTDDLSEAVKTAGFVFEAAPERLPLKQSIFAELVRQAPAEAILASNTSVIPIGKVAEGLASADRIVGTHWWNPPYLVPLVEVIQAAGTSDATVEAAMALLRSVGKTPAHVKKDVPGFVGNRLQHALWREAIAMVAEGICDAETLDTCVKNSFGLRLAALGPLENADLIGLDLTLDIHNTIIAELDRSAGPNPYLQQQVQAGHLGVKTGQGFRNWTDDEVTALRRRLTEHLLQARREKGPR